MTQMKALLIVPLLLASGCANDDCNSEGCEAHVRLRLTEALEDEGSYEIELIANGAEYSCNVTIPRSEDQCDEGLLVGREEISSAESGRAGDAIVGLRLSGEFESITISIFKENLSVSEHEIVPDYEGVEINGEGCGECPIAEHDL